MEFSHFLSHFRSISSQKQTRKSNCFAIAIACNFHESSSDFSPKSCSLLFSMRYVKRNWQMSASSALTLKVRVEPTAKRKCIKKKKSMKKADRGSISTFLLGTILLYCWIRGIQFLMIYTCTFCGLCQRVIESVCYFLSSLKRFKKYRDSRVDTAQRPNRLSKKCFVSFAAIIKHLFGRLKSIIQIHMEAKHWFFLIIISFNIQLQ